ncbi:MAG TPA: ABC transporter substrate-binding protein [Rhizomicrobium sp.]|nr:ABC transporter substrate-binding protein [Rhizomicrobium sp.]
MAASLSINNAPKPPQRIMSLTVCTDDLLMDLAPPSRIASISYLSREKAALRLWPEAAHLPVNHNSAEEILAERPDLVLTLTYASTDMEPLLEKSGTRMLEVPEPQNFDQIRSVTRMVGDAIGARARAEQLIARMDATLRALATGKPRQTIRVVGWGGGGFVPGGDTLFNAVLDAAGGRNIAAHDSYYDVESLIAARPDVLAFADDYIDTPSLRRDQNDHPLLMRLFANRRIVYPAAYFGCGTPESAGAALKLRQQLLQAMTKPGGVP